MSAIVSGGRQIADRNPEFLRVLAATCWKIGPAVSSSH
jgi:hypothetical protein